MNPRPLRLCLLLCWLGFTAPAAEPWSAVVGPDNSLNFKFLHTNAPVAQLGLAGWGPKWSWVGLEAHEKAAGDKLSLSIPFVVNAADGAVVDVHFEAWQSGARELKYRYTLHAAKDVPLTLLAATLGAEKDFAQGAWQLTRPDGRTNSFTLPVGPGAQPATAKAVLQLSGGVALAVVMDPPRAVAFDGDLRVLLAQDVVKAGDQTTTLTVTFPDTAALLARQTDLDALTRTLPGPDWFAFAPGDDLGPSVIGMENWLEQPAGRRGAVTIAGNQFQFADGTPIKFWGVNLAYADGCAPPKAAAEFTAARFAKYGVNAVRLHKFTYPADQNGIADPGDSTRMTPEGLERLDYFSAQLRQRGIYYAWSHTYGFHVTPGQRDRLLAYDEIAEHLKGNTYAFINLAEDAQNLLIQAVVNLLEHKNPHTGLTYAADPALAYLELQNEDDIFFYTTADAFNACPTYKKRFLARFADWLQAKYGSEENLRKAWGDALAPGESLAAKNIAPQTNPWFLGDGNLPRQTGGNRRRLLDGAQYFHELQNRFYARFVEAIRATGYRGALCGSPWQAPAMLPHYLNLRSDALVGFIDRHNYFGGGLFDSMLAQPGGGYFSSGLQQVAGRPFGLSEWTHVYPSLYSAEGPAIVAAYGLGLQGWDASFAFQAHAGPHAFDDRAGWTPWGVWQIDVPAQLGQFPALARMIYRGDVQPGAVISTRRVSPGDLAAGVFKFTDSVEQQGDVKTFGGGVPAEALAVGRVLVEFTEGDQPTTLPDLRKFRRGDTLVSTTEQLAWNTAGKGCFTLNTPGTKAVVGFTEGRTQTLGDVSIELQCPYASVFLTALEKDRTLANCRSALLTAVARNGNTGFKYFTVDNRILDNGTAPILLEPVKAAVAVAGRRLAAVNILDHAGRRTGRTLPVAEGRFILDGARDQTLYYELVFQP